MPEVDVIGTRVDAPIPATDTSSIRPSGAFRTGLLILVGTTIAWRWWTLSSWSWFQDDWIYLNRTTQWDFLDYITQNYNGHIMPGQFVIVWLITQLAPMDYAYAAGTTLFFATASVLAWAFALRTIFGERARLLYPLSIIALSPIFMPISLWWAAAIQTFPLQLFMGLSVLFTARFVMRGQHRRDLVGLVLSYALGLFFWQKALLLVIPIVAVAVLVAVGPLQDRLRTAVRVAVPPLVVTALYLPVYLYLTRYGDDANTTLFKERGFRESVLFFLTGVLDMGIPSLLGGPWQELSEPQQVFGSSSGVLTLTFLALGVGGAILTVRLRRHGWLIVVMALSYLVAAWGLLFTSSRYDIVGVFLVRDARYAADIVPVALLAVMFALTPTLHEPGNEWLRRTLHTDIPTWVGRSAGAVLVAAIAASAVFTSGRIWDASAPSSPKTWVDNVSSDIMNTPRGASVHDSNGPNHVIFSVYYAEDARISHLFSTLRPPVVYDAPSPRIYVANEVGRLMEMEVGPVARPAAPPTSADCGFLVSPGRRTVIPLKPALYSWKWGFQINYFSGDPGLLTLSTDTKSVEVPIQRGLDQMQLIVEDSVSELVLTGHPDSKPVCVTEVKAGPIGTSDRWVGDVGPR